MSAQAQPLLSVRIRQKFRKILSFLRKKARTSASEEPPPCPQNVSTEQTPLTADVFYGRPLMKFHTSDNDKLALTARP